MYPARFEYHAPGSVEDALEILERYGDEAKVLAGGQSLIPLMKLRFASPRALVDINRIEGLDYVAFDGDHLRVGALVRHADMERSQEVRSRLPLVSAVVPLASFPLVAWWGCFMLRAEVEPGLQALT